MTELTTSLRPAPEPVPLTPHLVESGEQPRVPLVAPVVVALAQALGVAAAVGAVAAMTPHLHVDDGLHRVALFVHLACLVLGFGAVLAVDWTALGWVLGRRSFREVLDTAGHVHGAIWLGYGGLVVSGLLLSPDLGTPLTLVKLGLVLLIGWNGLVAMQLHRSLGRVSAEPDQRALMVSTGCAGVSQACWWGATVIGFVNAG